MEKDQLLKDLEGKILYPYDISDVMIAINKGTNPYPIVGCIDDGEFLVNGEQGGLYQGTGVFWDYEKNLDLQSPEALKFLHDVLCR